MPDKEFDEIELENLIRDEQHKEIKNSLGRIVSAIEKIDNKDIVDEIKKQSTSIEKLSESIKLLPAPQVTLTNDSKEISQSIGQMASEIIQGQEKIINLLSKEKPKAEWDFKMYYMQGGRIDTINAKQIK